MYYDNQNTLPRIEFEQELHMLVATTVILRLRMVQIFGLLLSVLFYYSFTLNTRGSTK